MILKGRVINPGELRTPVTLQSRTIDTGDDGYQTPAWVNEATVYCRWRNAHGLEAQVGATAEAEAPATVLIRYRAGVDRTWALLLGSERYEIVSIDDIEARHEYLELKVRRMVAG